MPTIKRHRATAAAYAVMVEAMILDSYTVQELCEETGLHVNTVQKFVGALMHRPTRICGVTLVEDRLGRKNTPAYRLRRGRL